MSQTKADSSRNAEKLIAALHFEMHQGRGTSEILAEVMKSASHILFSEEFPDEDAPVDVADAALERCERYAVTLAEYVLRGLLAIERPDLAERIVEELARSRRECAARFNTEPAVPWAPGEQEALAANWGRHADDEPGGAS